MAIEATGKAIIPASDLPLLQSIVEAAARIFGAAAASIALVDEKASQLEFRVSSGAGNEEIVGMRIPLDKGIAGYVAMTGQPIAISNVLQDARFNQEFAESTGYVPDSILATPLFWGEQVIGVMSVLDKIEASSFGMEDMELLGIFANQAAIAIAQSQQIEQLNLALVGGISDLLSSSNIGDNDDLRSVLERLSDGIEGGQDVLAIANVFNAIGDLGESERAVCLQILGAFRDYVQSKPDFGF
jgi:GAF domain-containing protein